MDLYRTFSRNEKPKSRVQQLKARSSLQAITGNSRLRHFCDRRTPREIVKTTPLQWQTFDT